MPVNFSRILIFDDKPEEGIRIAKGLWRSGFSARFILWDAAVGDYPAENLNGVRIVFMDIDLLNDGNVSESKTFPVIQQALTHFLSPANGPYIIITWTTWAKDSEPLFAWLQGRMRKFYDRGIGPLPPIKMHIIDKEKIDELPDEGSKETELKKRIGNYLKELDAIACLTDWEAQIQNAGCETIHLLMSIANKVGSGDAGNDLKKTLWSLAKAEGEKHLSKENAQKSLYSVLSQIHFDRINHNLTNDNDLAKMIMEGENPGLPSVSHSEINSMLHLDYSKGGISISPGDVFLYPAPGHGIPIPGIADNANFLRANFLFETRCLKGEMKDDFIQRAKLLLIEKSPGCDYAQKKIAWNKFVVAALIPAEYIEYTWACNDDKTERIEGKPFGEFLWTTPQFSNNGKSFYIVFNSRLEVTLDCNQAAITTVLGTPMFRIRQALLNDMTGWLTRQTSRLGHVAVAP